MPYWATVHLQGKGDGSCVRLIKSKDGSESLGRPPFILENLKLKPRKATLRQVGRWVGILSGTRNPVFMPSYCVTAGKV